MMNREKGRAFEGGIKDAIGRRMKHIKKQAQWSENSANARLTARVSAKTD